MNWILNQLWRLKTWYQCPEYNRIYDGKIRADCTTYQRNYGGGTVLRWCVTHNTTWKVE